MTSRLVFPGTTNLRVSRLIGVNMTGDVQWSLKYLLTLSSSWQMRQTSPVLFVCLTPGSIFSPLLDFFPNHFLGHRPQGSLGYPLLKICPTHLLVMSKPFMLHCAVIFSSSLLETMCDLAGWPNLPLRELFPLQYFLNNFAWSMVPNKPDLRIGNLRKIRK